MAPPQLWASWDLGRLPGAASSLLHMCHQAVVAKMAQFPATSPVILPEAQPEEDVRWKLISAGDTTMPLRYITEMS